MNKEKLYELNQNDIARGIRSLKDKGINGVPISQSMLSQFSGVGNDAISKILNPEKNKDYSPTVRTISKLVSEWNMTLVDFYAYIERNKL